MEPLLYQMPDTYHILERHLTQSWLPASIPSPHHQMHDLYIKDIYYEAVVTSQWQDIGASEVVKRWGRNPIANIARNGNKTLVLTKSWGDHRKPRIYILLVALLKKGGKGKAWCRLDDQSKFHGATHGTKICPLLHLHCIRISILTRQFNFLNPTRTWILTSEEQITYIYLDRVSDDATASVTPRKI